VTKELEENRFLKKWEHNYNKKKGMPGRSNILYIGKNFTKTMLKSLQQPSTGYKRRMKMNKIYFQDN
jgi:hypothetical protein